MISYYLLVIIAILFILWVKALIKYHRVQSELYAQNDMYLYYRNKVSMIEYHHRKYREGKNPYTVLRDIGDILQDYYLKLGANNIKNE